MKLNFRPRTWSLRQWPGENVWQAVRAAENATPSDPWWRRLWAWLKRRW